MIIKSIELNNFRQYKGRQKIEFSTDKYKNVTIVKGENGAGKTTLLEAFTWCLYGTLNLPNKDNLITADIKNKMQINENIDVKVSIDFIHNDVEYYLERIMKFVKVDDSDDGILRYPAKFNLQFKNTDGIYKSTDKSNKMEEIENIIPKDLATYFFFDGERIENLSKSNREGKKDLNKAIRNILGLDVILNSEKHLKSLIEELTGDYSNDNDSKLLQFKEELSQIKNESVKKRKEKEVAENEIEAIQNKLNGIKEFLKKFDEIKVYAKDREGKERSVGEKKLRLDEIKKEIKKENKRGLPEFFMQKILDLCEKDINLDSLDNKAIAGIDGGAIKLLIERRVCICGHEINDDSLELANLLKQIEYQPPASLSIILKEFYEKSNSTRKIAEDFKEELINKFKSLRQAINTIETLESEIVELGNKVKNFEKSKELEIEREELEKELIENKLKLDTIVCTIDELQNKIAKIEANIDDQALNNEKNKIILKRKEYANAVLNEIVRFYDSKEEEIKKELNLKVQSIFNKLLSTKHELIIEDDYSFKIKDIDNEDSTSQGQDVITSFAFIGGIIDTARINHNEIEVNEPYPLIMDAPFAKLSKIHRRNVASLLPTIAEQFILITVDSQYEGDIEETLRDKIGKEYELIMHMDNEKYTEIVER